MMTAECLHAVLCQCGNDDLLLFLMQFITPPSQLKYIKEGIIQITSLRTNVSVFLFVITLFEVFL